MVTRGGEFETLKQHLNWSISKELNNLMGKSKMWVTTKKAVTEILQSAKSFPNTLITFMKYSTIEVRAENMISPGLLLRVLILKY